MKIRREKSEGAEMHWRVLDRDEIRVEAKHLAH